MGDDIGSGLLSMAVCFDFCSTNVVQLSNRNPYFYQFLCHHPLITQLSQGHLMEHYFCIIMSQGRFANKISEFKHSWKYHIRSSRRCTWNYCGCTPANRAYHILNTPTPSCALHCKYIRRRYYDILSCLIYHRNFVVFFTVDGWVQPMVAAVFDYSHS